MSGDIPLPLDGFPSLQDRDRTYSDAKKRARKAEERASKKAFKSLAKEQENLDVLENTIKKDRELSQKRIVELLGDIRDLIAIIMKHPELLEKEDLDFINKLTEKMKKANITGD